MIRRPIDTAERRCSHPHFSQVCRPDRANPMPAGTSVAISDAVGTQAVTISRAGLRCSGNDLRPAVRVWGVYGEKFGLTASISGKACRPDRANPMPAGTSVAITDAVGSQAVTISRAGLRCSGNDLRTAVRLWVVYGEKSGLTALISGKAEAAICWIRPM